MSNALMFLLAAVAMIVLGGGIAVLLYREGPSRMDATVDQFGERLRSLAPPSEEQPVRRTISSEIPGGHLTPDMRSSE